MAKIDALVQDFLAQKRIAVVGVSDKRDTGCNLGYRKFKDAGYAGAQSYQELKQELIAQGVLATSDSETVYRFTRAYAFKSPSAAAAVILDRNSNGRREWKVVDSRLSYHEWQEQKSATGAPA